MSDRAHRLLLILLAESLLLAALAPVGRAEDEQPAPPRLLAWNDLGMHCMDPDYSVFSILPPYNTIHAQLMMGGDVVPVGPPFVVTYEAQADATGSINTTSAGKTNFWDHEDALFGVDLPVDTGLAGDALPGPANTPQPMHADPAWNWQTGEGLPITPIDDAGATNTYPLMRLVARNGAGQQVATTVTTLPVSQEMDCSLCHASAASPFARPEGGWAFDPDPLTDDRWNILALHDDRQAGDPLYASALSDAGYDAAGLEATAAGGTPILCAACHASNALPGTGLAGVSPLTVAVHGLHGGVLGPDGLALDDDASRNACYACHPGQATQCLRGAMGQAVASDGSLAMECQSCHGNQSAVGDPGRVGWLEQPSCQQCHTGTALDNAGAIRFTSVFDGNGNPHVAADPLFASQPDVPAPGFDLYRFSEGHGGLQCSACHGSPHAIYPSSHDEDNLQSLEVQGHVGTIIECGSCHATPMETWLTGPHGMHPVDLDWAKDRHSNAAEHLGLDSCRACHGVDLRGSELSRAHAERSYPIGEGFGTKTFFRGAEVTCFACHDGPGTSDATDNHAPNVSNLVVATPLDEPLAIALVGNDPDGDPLSWRVLEQPDHGLVGLVGSTATYTATGGDTGTDLFTVAAFDGSVSSKATIRVQRSPALCQGTVEAYGFGCPDGAGQLPLLAGVGCAQGGGQVDLLMTGAPAHGNGLMVLGTTRATTPKAGGCVLRVGDLLPVVPALVADAAGQSTISAAIPASVVDVTLTLQAFWFDASVGHGYTSSNGLELVFP